MTVGRVRLARRARIPGVRGWLSAALVVAVLAGCQPSAPPGFTGSPPPEPGPSGAPVASGGGPVGSGVVAGKPVVTLDGSKVTVLGLGNGQSPPFDLPAGSAQMTVSVCASNQVIPFVTLYDAAQNKLGIVVEPTYTLKGLVGGSYYLDVATNPTCSWQIVISPG